MQMWHIWDMCCHIKNVLELINWLIYREKKLSEMIAIPSLHNNDSGLLCAMFNKKFELMLTRRAKSSSSSSLQTVSLSPAISLQFILKVCAAAEDRKNQ